MADKAAKFEAGTKFFRSSIPTLSVVVGDPDPTKGEVAPPIVRFEPYFEEQKGVEGQVKVGYLATNEGSAIKKLTADPNVTTITEDEYLDATEPAFDEAGVQYAGVRAPY